MYFSKITLKSTIDRANYAEVVCSNTYKEHQILWKLFNGNPDAKREFIYRYEPQRNTPAYYLVSTQKPVDQNNLWNIQSKHYKPVVTTGQQFSFMLRVNPVKTKNGKRHDVVMYEKYQLNYKNMDRKIRPTTQELVEKTGRKWLAKRAETSGFIFDDNSIQIDSYQPKVSGRKKGKKEIRYSTMDFQGILTISDPEQFTQTLMQGIGKARAFGCGLMLIRRV